MRERQASGEIEVVNAITRYNSNIAIPATTNRSLVALVEFGENSVMRTWRSHDSEINLQGISYDVMDVRRATRISQILDSSYALGDELKDSMESLNRIIASRGNEFSRQPSYVYK